LVAVLMFRVQFATPLPSVTPVQLEEVVWYCQVAVIGTPAMPFPSAVIVPKTVTFVRWAGLASLTRAATAAPCVAGCSDDGGGARGGDGIGAGGGGSEGATPHGLGVLDRRCRVGRRRQRPGEHRRQHVRAAEREHGQEGIADALNGLGAEPIRALLEVLDDAPVSEIGNIDAIEHAGTGTDQEYPVVRRASLVMLLLGTMDRNHWRNNAAGEPEPRDRLDRGRLIRVQSRGQPTIDDN
jgi:hypothetical protein